MVTSPARRSFIGAFVLALAGPLAACEQVAGLGGDFHANIQPQPLDSGMCVKTCGQITELYSDPLSNIQALQMDDSYLYFASVETTGAQGTVGRIPLSGGRATVLAKGDNPVSLAVDKQAAYVIVVGSYGSIARIPLDGTKPETIVGNQPNPSSLVLTGTSLLWITEDTSAGIPSYGVNTAALDGSLARTLFGSAVVNVSEIVTDGTDIYSAINEGTNGAVRRTPAGGGVSTDIIAGKFGPVSLLIHGSTLYFITIDASGGGATIWSFPLAPGSKPLSLITDPSGGGALAVDDESIYWVSGITIKKMPLAGGTPVTLVSAQQYTGRLLVDRASVYWAAGGAIRKMPIDGIICQDPTCP